MDYGHGGNDGVLLRRSGEYIRTAHWSASPYHSTFSHSHQHNHLQQASMSFNDSSSCMDNVLGMIHGSPPPSPLLITRLRPVLPLLILGVVRLPNHLVLPASLIRQSPPLSPSMLTATSSVGEIASSLTLSSPKSADGLKVRLSAMIGSRTSIFRTLFMLGRSFGGTGTGTWS